MHTVRTLKVKSQMRRNRKCGNQMVVAAGGVADPSLILNFKLSTMTTTEGFAPQPSFPAAIFPRLSPWFSARDFVLELPSSCLFFLLFFFFDFTNMWQNYFRSKIDFRPLTLFKPHFCSYLRPFASFCFRGNWKTCKWQWQWRRKKMQSSRFRI